MMSAVLQRRWIDLTGLDEKDTLFIGVSAPALRQSNQAARHSGSPAFLIIIPKPSSSQMNSIPAASNAFVCDLECAFAVLRLVLGD